VTKARAGDAPLGRGRFLELVCTVPDPGRDHGWEYVRRYGSSGVVCIAAVTADDELVLVEQPRPAVGTTVIEMPAGLAGDIVGSENEDLSEAARRELLEETGYACAEMTWIGKGPSSAGLTSEIIDFYLATGLRREGNGGGDETESIEVHHVKLSELREWLASCEARGALVEPKIYSGLYLAKLLN
jgi:ADP-ribose pyrophosphatase